MANYQEARVKITNTPLNKLKSAAKKKDRKNIRINKKKIEDEELTHELFLTTKQATKIKKCLCKQHVNRYKT